LGSQDGAVTESLADLTWLTKLKKKKPAGIVMPGELRRKVE